MVKMEIRTTIRATLRVRVWVWFWHRVCVETEVEVRVRIRVDQGCCYNRFNRIRIGLCTSTQGRIRTRVRSDAKVGFGVGRGSDFPPSC